MKTVNINTEILDYNIIVEGFVMSGFVHDINVEFQDISKNEVPNEDMEEIIEKAKEILLDHYYNKELSF